MKRYPLQTLIDLRAHRTALAERALAEAQRETRRCREACARIEAEIARIHAERGRQRARLLDPPAPGVAWSATLARREAHIDLLGEQAEAARQQLTAAQQRLREAEQAQAEARSAFFRAKARQDALDKRKDLWRGQQRALAERHEENATAERLQATHRPRNVTLQ